MAVGDHRLVEGGSQAGLQLAFAKGDRRCLGDGGEHGDMRLVQLDAAGGLAGCGDGAFDQQDAFWASLCFAEWGQRLIAGGDDLDDAPAVAEDKEADPPEAAQRMEPARHLDALANVCGNLDGADTTARWR